MLIALVILLLVCMVVDTVIVYVQRKHLTETVRALEKLRTELNGCYIISAEKLAEAFIRVLNERSIKRHDTD